MVNDEIIRKWNIPRGPIKRRWARSIGPYRGLVYFVNEHNWDALTIAALSLQRQFAASIYQVGRRVTIKALWGDRARMNLAPTDYEGVVSWGGWRG